MSKLPTRDGGWSQPFMLYNNYWIHPLFVQGIIRLQTCFKPRQDDIIIVSNPKCGTTWTKALAFAIANCSRYELAGKHHPLLSCHPQDLVPSMEILPQDADDLNYLESIMATSANRVMYVCREPEDTFMSWWHFATKLHENMIAEPVKLVKRLTAFLGVTFNTKEEEDGVPKEVVRLCNFYKLSGLHANQTGQTIRTHDMVLDRSVFFRKGKINCVIEEKLKGSGLVF
ncbi:hypothetical protein BS78_03G412100 [Paspalum vaginatum]|nr:hypothetical protein BS78_03G412100 [Paspalum vaginatum]